jgi:helix-turn-helix protein
MSQATRVFLVPKSAGKKGTRKEKFMERKKEMPAALKMREAREYLGGLSTPTIHRLVKRGLLRPNKSTRHLIFLRSDLEKFLRDGQS